MGVQATAIAENLERVCERITRAAARAGRKPGEITLVAVSKTFPAEAIRAAFEAGVRHFGENRVQEWESKQPLLADLDATWHLVGHLQSNKAARAARLFHTIDSLDSIALAERLDRAVAISGAPVGTGKASGGQSERLSVLIEVRLAPEETKSGALEAELPRLVEAVLALPQLNLRGLMCIPPFFEDPERARPYFSKLRELRNALRRQFASALATPSAAPLTATAATMTRNSDPVLGGEEALLPELSMGMSHDFEVAIEEGATQVRLGTAIFGARLHPG